MFDGADAAAYSKGCEQFACELPDESDVWVSAFCGGRNIQKAEFVNAAALVDANRLQRVTDNPSATEASALDERSTLAQQHWNDPRRESHRLASVSSRRALL